VSVSGPAVVALGGGHGLAASLTALRGVTDRLTAIVTVADDGGSSGRLRRELGALPPGDLRMALAALAGDDAWGRQWAALLQHRFPGAGELAGHAVGNLMLTALTDLLADDAVTALDLIARLLGARGRVLPLSTTPLDIQADVAQLDPADPAAVSSVRGQVAVAITSGQVLRVRLEPTNPTACPEAVEAVRDADWVVFGPGSWFTSVLPHLLVPGLAAALTTTSARRLVVLNLAPQHGETAGFSPERHLEVLAEHAPGLTADVVLADVSAVPGPDRLRAAAAGIGAQLVLAPVAVGDGTPRHDPLRLAAAYAGIFAADRVSAAPSSAGAKQAGGVARWR
jgi:uncharacterized cofD-like protein